MKITHVEVDLRPSELDRQKRHGAEISLAWSLCDEAYRVQVNNGDLVASACTLPPARALAAGGVGR